MQLREVLLGLGGIARGKIAFQVLPLGVHVLAVLVQVLLVVVQRLPVLVQVAVVLIEVVQVVPNRVLVRTGLRMPAGAGCRPAPRRRKPRQAGVPMPRWIAFSCYAPWKRRVKGQSAETVPGGYEKVRAKITTRLTNAAEAVRRWMPPQWKHSVFQAAVPEKNIALAPEIRSAGQWPRYRRYHRYHPGPSLAPRLRRLELPPPDDTEKQARQERA